jgi:hypothetical protein
VREEWKTEYAEGVRIVENDNKLYEMANEYDELDKEWDEEVYREWIKTYNGGIKKIRKMKRKRRKNT